MKTTTRDATAADIFAFYGQHSPHSIRARVLERDGEVVGLAGYYLKNGHALVWCETKGELPKMTIWREAVKYMKSLTLPAICYGTDQSAAFLERLGFRYQWTDDEGDLYYREAAK